MLKGFKFILAALVVAASSLACSRAEPVDVAEQALCWGGVQLVRAVPATHSVVFDTFIIEDEGSQNVNKGDGQVMLAGLYNGAGTERDVLLYAALPTGWTGVSSATWTLYRGPVSGSNAGTLRLRPLAATWDEDQAAGSMPGALGLSHGVTWANQPATTCSDDTCDVGTLAIAGTESSWSVDVTAYYNAVLGGTQADNGLFLDKTDGGSGSGYGASTQFWASECTVSGCGKPTLTLCP